MTPDTELTDEQRKILVTVEKLLRLADKNTNAEESASAAQKAQELLLAYNLSADLVGSGSDHGRREESKVRGGFYEYQRDLWCRVADLNFCFHFVSRQRITKRVRFEHWSGEMRTEERVRYEPCHRLVGRVHNVAATKAMATYLQDAIERLVSERIGTQNNLRFSRYMMSYREGITFDINERLYKRRQSQLAEERRKAMEAEARAAEAAAKGASTATGVTIASLTRSEFDANADFLYGEGWSAQQAAKRAAKAAAAAAAEQEYNRWAAAHPEEARKQEAERKAAELKAEEKEARRSRGGPKKEIDYGAWWAGREAGKKIGLDVQAEGVKSAGALR